MCTKKCMQKSRLEWKATVRLLEETKNEYDKAHDN